MQSSALTDSAAAKVERKQPSTDVRRAIWEVWDRKSAFTGSPVPWAQLHVDHVIPIAGAQLLEGFREKGMVPADFDINGLENLLPSLNHQNQGKAADALSDNALVWFLELARKKKPVIERRLQAALRSNEALKSYLVIKAAAEKNDISLEEMAKIYAHQFDGEVTLRITPQIEVGDLSSTNAKLAANLMDKPFALGGGAINEVRLHSDSGDVVVCKTSNEFIDAQDRGYFPMTQADITIASLANETSEALRAIRDSEFAENSRLREPIITFKHLDRWSAEWVLAGLIDPDDDRDFSDIRTISDALAAEICEIESLEDHEVRFVVPDGLDVMMREILRADLDADKWEEILVFHYVSAARAGGSLRAGSAMTAKVGEDGLISPSPYPPVDAKLV